LISCTTCITLSIYCILIISAVYMSPISYYRRLIRLSRSYLYARACAYLCIQKNLGSLCSLQATWWNKKKTIKISQKLCVHVHLITHCNKEKERKRLNINVNRHCRTYEHQLASSLSVTETE
jgi:hypothetical protein